METKFILFLFYRCGVGGNYIFNKKLLLLLFIFIIIQIPLILYSSLPSDEMVYYLFSREVSKGIKLYEQTFFSHPPLQIWIYTTLNRIFGFHIFILKSFTLLVSVGCCFLVYLISQEKYGTKIGLISSFIFLTSYDILLFGSFAFGLEIAVLFFLISFYLLEKNEFISGLFFALTIMTRLHLLPLGILLLIFSKKRLNFLYGSSICIVYYALLFRLVPESIPQILGYHISKSYFFGGWISYFKSSIHLWVLFFFSLSFIKDKKLLFIGSAYLAFLLILKSTFEYYFLLVTVILCIEGSNSLIHSKQKRLLWFMVFLFIFLLVFRAVPFLVNQTKGYNEFAGYINTLEKPLVGQSAITALLALKTNKNISGLQIDTNFQRNAIYDYSNAIVVYEEGLFKGKEFNCSILDIRKIEKKKYEVWSCP